MLGWMGLRLMVRLESFGVSKKWRYILYVIDGIYFVKGLFWM